MSPLALPPFGTGLIYGREYLNAADVLRKANIGDTISAKVVDSAGRDGYIELSLKEARQALIWSEAEAAQQLKAYGPNRLPSSPAPSPLRRFLKQFDNLLIYALLAAAGISAILGQAVDAVVIVVVVILNAAIGGNPDSQHRRPRR